MNSLCTIKKDKEGKLILDNEGKTQAIDYVNTGNNNHEAIYRCNWKKAK